MASQKILAQREYTARQRIGEVIAKAREAGVEIGELVPNHRFPDVGRVEELEYFGLAFEKLVEALYLPTPQPTIAQEVEQPDDTPKPTLTPKTAEVLAKAGIEASESLTATPDDVLKAAGLKPAQIKNVRAVYGEFKPAE